MTKKNARQRQVTKIPLETTSAGATIPKINCKQDLAVIKFIEIKPLVLTRSTESGNKNCRKTTSALEPQNTFI